MCDYRIYLVKHCSIISLVDVVLFKTDTMFIPIILKSLMVLISVATIQGAAFNQVNVVLNCIVYHLQSVKLTALVLLSMSVLKSTVLF